MPCEGVRLVDVPLNSLARSSRHHATIEFNPDTDTFDLRCHSPNGLYVNGVYLSAGFVPIPLRNKALVQVTALP